MNSRCVVTLLALIPLGAACDTKSKVSISEPPRGSMLEAGSDVTIRGKADADRLIVGGTEIKPSGSFEVVVPEADGLGFVAARIPDDPLFDVRSWHQGTYREPAGTHSGTITISAGNETLHTDSTSMAGLVSGLLVGEELAGYVDNPLDMTITVVVPVNVDVTVTSVTSPTIAVDLEVVDSILTFDASLEDVVVDYTASAVSLSSSGTALYDTMTLSGNVALTPESAILTDVTVTASDPAITDSGGLPPAGVEALAGLLADEIPQAIETAAANAADAVFTGLIGELKPEIGIDFDRPITQHSAIETVTLAGTNLGLGYGTRIEAATPTEAAEGHGVLERTTGCTEPHSAGLQVDVGSALVNQLAFAVWDAGNLDGISFTKSELQDLGMGELDFPYSQLESADITLLLPPLLEWDSDGPRFHIGGVQIDIAVSGVEDSTAWTAASVPVDLGLDGDALRITVDGSRDVTLEDVGFDRMSSLADQDKVMRLLEAAVPGVVLRVFSALPAITMPRIELSRLDGSPGPVIVPDPLGVAPLSACWRLDLALALE
jgi:hypothetical protein